MRRQAAISRRISGFSGDVAHDMGEFPDRDVKIPALIVETVPDQKERDGGNDNHITHGQSYRTSAAAAIDVFDFGQQPDARRRMPATRVAQSSSWHAS